MLKKIEISNRNQFIYRDINNKEKVDQMILELEEKYPIKTNGYNPMVIKLNDIDVNDDNIYGLSNVITSAIGRGFLSYSVLYEIYSKINDELKESDIDKERLCRLYNVLNNYNIDTYGLDRIKESLRKYKDNYKSMFNDLSNSAYSNLIVSHIDLSRMLTATKNMLNNDAYFALFIDMDGVSNVVLEKTINSIIGSRYNADLSIKVISDGSKKRSKYNLEGKIIDSYCDYGNLYLDDSREKSKVLYKS